MDPCYKLSYFSCQGAQSSSDWGFCCRNCYCLPFLILYDSCHMLDMIWSMTKLPICSISEIQMAGKGQMTIFGPPDLFANDMRKLINDTEFRLAAWNPFFILRHSNSICSDILFIVGEEKEKIHAHKVILSGRFALRFFFSFLNVKVTLSDAKFSVPCLQSKRPRMMLLKLSPRHTIMTRVPPWCCRMYDPLVWCLFCLFPVGFLWLI